MRLIGIRILSGFTMALGMLLFVSGLFAQTPVQITQNTTSETHPVFSPDGTKLAFNQGVDIYVKDLTANDPPVLFQANAQHPSWSPDGTQIAFIDLTQSGRGYKKNLDGTGYAKVVDLSGSWDNIAWSPSGRYFAVSNAAGGTAVVDTSVDLTHNYWCCTGRDLAWSPDERWMVYEENGNIYVRVVDSDANGFPDGNGGPYVIYADGNAKHPWFLPDSKHIVFSAHRADAFGSMDYEIFVKSIDLDSDGVPDEHGTLEQVTVTSNHHTGHYGIIFSDGNKACVCVHKGRRGL